jgi:hypothetical protein
VSVAERYGVAGGAPWYLLSLLGSGYAPLLPAVLGFAWLAAAAQLAVLGAGRYAAYARDRSGSRGARLLKLARHVRAARNRPAAVEDRQAMEG